MLVEKVIDVAHYEAKRSSAPTSVDETLSTRLPVYSLDVQPGEGRLATAGGSAARLWAIPEVSSVEDQNTEPVQQNEANISKGVDSTKLLAVLRGHTGSVNCVRWAPRGVLVASGSDDTTVRIFMKQTGPTNPVFSETPTPENWPCVLVCSQHTMDIVDISWAPDSRTLASCALDRTICIWNVAGALQRGMRILSEVIVTLRGHESFVKGLSWDPVGTYLISASEDNSIIVWRTEDWQVDAKVMKPYKRKNTLSSFYRRPSWSPTGELVSTTHGYQAPHHTAPILDREDNWQVAARFIGHTEAIVTTRFNSKLFFGNNNTDHTSCCAVAGLDCVITVWLTNSPRPIVVLRKLFERPITDLTWSSDGYTLYACSIDGTIAAMKFEKSELGESINDVQHLQIMKDLYGEVVHGSHSMELAEDPMQLGFEANRDETSVLSEDTSHKTQHKDKEMTEQQSVDLQKESVTKGGRRRIQPMLIPSTVTCVTEAFGSNLSRSTVSGQSPLCPIVNGSLSSKNEITSQSQLSKSKSLAKRLLGKSDTPVTSNDTNNSGIEISKPSTKRRVSLATISFPQSNNNANSGSNGKETILQVKRKTVDSNSSSKRSASFMSRSSHSNSSKRMKKHKKHKKHKHKHRNRDTSHILSQESKVNSTEANELNSVEISKIQALIPINILPGLYPVKAPSVDVSNLTGIKSSNGGWKYNVSLSSDLSSRFTKDSSSAACAQLKTISATEGISQVRVLKSDGSVIWQDRIISPAGACGIACGNNKFVAVACEGHSGGIFLFSPAGRRMLPQIVLGKPISHMCCSIANATAEKSILGKFPGSPFCPGNQQKSSSSHLETFGRNSSNTNGTLSKNCYLMVLCTTGDIFIWDVLKLKQTLKCSSKSLFADYAASDAVIDINTNGNAKTVIQKNENIPGNIDNSVIITEARVMSNGSPLLTLRSKTTGIIRSYTYHQDMGVWMHAAATDEFVDSDFKAVSATIDEIVPVNKGKDTFERLDGNPGNSSLVNLFSGSNFSAESAAITTRAHLETEVARSEFLQLPDRYRKWLSMYVRHLRDVADITRLRELLESMLEQPMTDDAVNREVFGSNGRKNNTPGMVCGMLRRELLQNTLLPVIRGNRALQNIANEFQEAIDITKENRYPRMLL